MLRARSSRRQVGGETDGSKICRFKPRCTSPRSKRFARFHKLSQLIVQQREELASHDELEMAVTRIRVRSEYEMPDLYAIPVWKNPYRKGLRASIVHREEIAAMSVNYTQQKSVYDSDLRKSMSQLQYLESTLR